MRAGRHRCKDWVMLCLARINIFLHRGVLGEVGVRDVMFHLDWGDSASYGDGL